MSKPWTPTPTRLFLSLLALAALLCLGAPRAWSTPPVMNDKLAAILDSTLPQLRSQLAKKGLYPGGEVFVRIFKLPGELEVWMRRGERFQLFKRYQICDFSGFPGPKIHEGDWQSPEGFYRITSAQMNPESNYHLSFNLGFPNEYDQQFGRTGSALMVHGGCSSMGCFAMTNDRIEEIYTLIHLALADGQQAVDVHVFPFPLTDANLAKFGDSPWRGFWLNLKEGFDAFEQSRQVPEVRVSGRRYVVERIRLARQEKSR